MKETELKPCPFCGGKAYVYTSGNESCGFFEEIICKNVVAEQID